MYLYNGGQVMSLNMSGPRMTLAPLIRVLVSSDGVLGVLRLRL